MYGKIITVPYLSDKIPKSGNTIFPEYPSTPEYNGRIRVIEKIYRISSQDNHPSEPNPTKAGKSVTNYFLLEVGKHAAR